MTDINKLRRLAQAAISKMNALDPEFVSSVTPLAVLELLDRIETAEKERKMDGERIADLMADLNRVGHENEELRKALAQKVTSETMLRDFNVGNGSINASFEGGAVHLLVDSLATQFVESGAHNYIEMQFHSEATGPLLLTLQRVDGATPHELRVKAENDRDTLRAKIAEMEQQH